MRLQIGNLNESVEDRTLARLFARHGAVLDAHVATHWDTGRSTGVGFVEMQSDHEGETAIAALNGHPHLGRMLTVCRTTPGAESSRHSHGMFGPLNITDKEEHPEGHTEQRGLPSEDRK